MKITLEVEAVEKPHGYYVDVDNIRLVVEGGEIVGWYAPNGLASDSATMVMEVEIMEQRKLAGKHVLSGIETGQVERETWGYRTELHGYVKFTLDGVTYMAEEDPDDGYRSYMKDLVIVEEPCKIRIPEVPVICRMESGGNCKKANVLTFIDAENGKDILAIGTDYSDEWYPCCVMRYMPENMSCNEGKMLDGEE